MTEPTRLIQKEATQYFGVSAQALRNWESEDWFPESGRTSEGYDVELIEKHKSQYDAGKEAEAVKRPSQTRFRPECPRSPNHAAEVRKTDGKIRHCVCQSCGHSFKQVGPENPQRELLNQLASELSGLESHQVKGQEVVIMTAESRNELVQLCGQ